MSKVETVRRFAKLNPRKEEIPKRNLFMELNELGSEIGQTNFGKVIQEILVKAKKSV